MNMFASIEKMTNEIVRIMDGNIRGVWLYGSVVMDDHRPGWSDIDFIALTDGQITEAQAKKLLNLRQVMLEKEPSNPYYRSFEGIIANAEEYKCRSFTRLVYWGTSGQRVTDRYAPDIFAEFELANKGRQVYGSAPWILPAPSREALVCAVRAHYDSMRRFAVQTDESIYSCGWLLDIARCIYTLRYNDVVSKTRAGEWALDQHIFTDEEPLKKTLEIRREPLSYKDDGAVKRWFGSLGPVVQKYADSLGLELSKEQ